MTFGQQSNRIRWKKRKIRYNRPENLSDFVKKRKIRAITAFKVIKGYRLIVTWHSLSYRFGVIAAYCSNFGHCVFEPPCGGLGTTYDVYLGLIGKHVDDFLLVLIEVFSLGITAKSLRAKRSKIGDFAPTRSLWSKISGTRGRPPPIIFARLVRPMNALQLYCWQFSHKETL